MTTTFPVSTCTAPPLEVLNTTRRRHAALALLVSAQFVVMLDTSIVNVALPSIQADLGLTATGLTWVVNAYALAFGGLLLTFGRVADLIGRRRMFVGGAALFTVGSVLAACAPSEQLLIAGRLVQGAGAAGLSPAAMAMLLSTFSGGTRARAMSLWGAASAVGGATGVVVGGLLAGSLGWPAVFLVTVPVTIAAVALAPRVLDEAASTGRRGLDVRGALIMTGAVMVLLHSSLSVGEGALEAGAAGLAAFAGLSALFVLSQRRSTDPLVPLELFRSRELTVGTMLSVLGGATRASTFVLVALYLQQALTMAPQQAGLAMVPTSLTGFAFSLLALPRLLRALGPQRSLVLGLVILAAGQLWLAWAPSHDNYLIGVLPALLLVAVGVALSFTPTTMVVASAVPSHHAGLASGLAGSGTQVGAALGTATFTAIGLAAGAGGAGHLEASGYTAAFTAAAAVALTTAVLGASLAWGPRRVA